MPNLTRFTLVQLARCKSPVVAVVLAVVMSSPSQAGSPKTEIDESDPATSRVAQALVAEALLAEAQGDLLTRQRLLIEAEHSGDSPLAKWHRGKMQDGEGHWISIAESLEVSQKDVLTDDYERRRANSPDNLRSHFVIAAWCARQELWDQCRSHLHRVLEFDPDNSVAPRPGLRGCRNRVDEPRTVGGSQSTSRRRSSFGQKVWQAASRLAQSTGFTQYQD